ncbi:YbaK/EbsC family protein [Bifidobacterium sp.]|jgi:Ala-tRNA(Pro) deacylase|uniref:YbaK/EbsC family protein n=1 Tax=Bifidobacterium sp. TaxID=41200 RepID=UPI0025BF6855|nr:YbaK/EbsC family protein [Bifidobacterium sp.]MCH4209975.1 hypothetical protein [Bifidobacterium sp.]MCI1225546.1 hypothetical protein [Bifidobacterium sp.]
MSVSVATVEDLLDSLHLPYEVKRHAPITSVQEALESGVLGELGITAGDIVKNLLLNDTAGECYLLVAPGMGRTDLKSMARHIGSTRLSFASLKTFGTVFGPSKGHVTLFDLLDDDDRIRNVHLVLDARVAKIAGNTAFHVGTNTVSVLVRAADTPTIASAIQPSYITI